MPTLDQPREIGVRRMNGHTAHRHGHPLMFAARSECNIERRRCGLGIIKEQLKKIAHPVKQQAIGGFCLKRKILRHHWSRWRGSVGHQHPDSEFAAWLKAIFP